MRTRGSTVAVRQSDTVKFLALSAKGGATQRKIKTAKLPTSIEELNQLAVVKGSDTSVKKPDPPVPGNARTTSIKAMRSLLKR